MVILREKCLFFCSISYAQNVHILIMGKEGLEMRDNLKKQLQMNVLYAQTTLKLFKTNNIKIVRPVGKNRQHIQQIIHFLMNSNIKFERSSFGLTSHKTSMCSVVLTPHQLKMV